MHSFVRFASILLLTVLFKTGFAQRYAPEDVAALPEYCRHTQGFPAYATDSSAAAYWKQKIGPVFMHMHHYCRGLLMINKARGASPKAKAKWYSSSIKEIGYVLNYVQEDYVLLPEMLTRKGEALLHLKRYYEADTNLRKAIELKRDYWPSYAMLAEGLLARNDVTGARAVLKDGVSQVGDPRELQRMLDDLDRGGR